jgi:uncharacterized protein YdhG (YjbR/CyaY superfamily)
MDTKQYKTIDEYLASFSGDTKKRLETIRKIIKDTVPAETKEKISYGIPTFYLNGNLVHFAGYKSHIGFYPGSAPIKEFASDLAQPIKLLKAPYSSLLISHCP